MKVDMRSLLLLGAFSLSLQACSSDRRDSAETATVKLTVVQVPADVSCLELTATIGGNTVRRFFSVTPGSSASLTATGMPVGAVALYEYAYPVACSARTDTTAATWVSEGIVNVTLWPGQIASLTIYMVRAGQLGIINAFVVPDDGGPPRDAGPDLVINNDRGPDVVLGPDLGPDLPVGAADRGPDVVLGPDLSPDLPVGAADRGPDFALGPDLRPDLPLGAADLGPDLPVGTADLGPDLHLGSDLPLSSICSPAQDMSGGQSGPFNTTQAVCKRTAQDIAGWGCANFEGRTLKVNGLPVVCGGPLPAKLNGYFTFDVSSGSSPYASLYWW